MPKPDSEPPTLDEYLTAMRHLAKLLRAAYDAPGSVNRSNLLEALETYERLDLAAMA